VFTFYEQTKSPPTTWLALIPDQIGTLFYNQQFSQFCELPLRVASAEKIFAYVVITEAFNVVLFQVEVFCAVTPCSAVVG